MSREIPIFFSTDDNYIPYLDVAISSLIANASQDYIYKIIVLNTGLKKENIVRVKRNERPGVSVNFINICLLEYFCVFFIIAYLINSNSQKLKGYHVVT